MVTPAIKKKKLMKRRKEDLTTFNSSEKGQTVVLYSFHLFYVLKDNRKQIAKG